MNRQEEVLNALSRSFKDVCGLAYENAPDAIQEVYDDFMNQMTEVEIAFNKAMEEIKPLLKPEIDHSGRLELLGTLADTVEDLLEEKGFTPEDFPNDDRNGDEGEAILYGCDYDRITGDFEDILIRAGLIDLEKE